MEAEVFDDEIDPDHGSTDKTVTLSVAEDGSKVEAQTPEGTRVGTPSAVPSSSKGSGLRGWSSGKGSYASALKAKQTDWHLEFSMDDHPLPLDLTIYGAIHQHELRKKKAGSGSALPPHLLWQGVYTIKFKKVSGPAGGSGETSEPVTRSRSPTPSLSSLPEDAPHAKILRLLRVLHRLNVVEAERQHHSNRNLPESAFVNNKLSAKLTRQLEEPMIVASQCLPDWALDLPQHFAFLFPFATRYNFLQSTSFGYARLILKWQSQQTRSQDSSRRDDGVGFLGRLQRQKVRISRKHILESAMKVFELYGSSSSILEVEYFEEVGTGLGPTLEFYALVSREFARRDLKIWRDDDPLRPGPYVFHPRGLFPAPISAEDIANDGDPKRMHIIRVIGQFVAKAMLDSRIIDMSFNKVFLKLALGEEIPLTIETLKLVDEDLAKSLEKLRSLTASTRPFEKLQRLLREKVDVEDLALDFTIPGYDIELRPNGRNITVTSENVEEYIAEVLEAILGQGARLQAKAFREGFSKVFPITDLQAFALDELVMLFGNAEEDWSIETLNEAIKADHGFNVESRTIRSLVEIMSEFDVPTRRHHLQFLTGSPKLPIGGFRGLNPPLTVVRKPHEAPLKADDYLPSVMTCVNYLKLPEYSSKVVMLEKLQVAMKEGVGSFHLS
jgi:E3 ubiquitin-protein ligase TRIP12